jgi:hypothetical protein
MMIPQFVRFYGYTLADTFNEYAVSFFSLVNSMYRLQARERLDGILEVAIGMAGKEGKSTISKLEEQAEGLNKYIREAKVVRDVNKRR